MSIEMHPAEVHHLADVLRAAAGDAHQIAVRLGAAPSMGSAPLQAAVDIFLESHRAAGRAVAGELAWLGDTVAAVADAWLRLDASLVAPQERPPAE
jgi:hypothetical protein